MRQLLHPLLARLSCRRGGTGASGARGRFDQSRAGNASNADRAGRRRQPADHRSGVAFGPSRRTIAVCAATCCRFIVELLIDELDAGGDGARTSLEAAMRAIMIAVLFCACAPRGPSSNEGEGEGEGSPPESFTCIATIVCPDSSATGTEQFSESATSAKSAADRACVQADPSSFACLPVDGGAAAASCSAICTPS